MKNMIVAVDPGPEKSAIVVWDGKEILFADHAENDIILEQLTRNAENKTPVVIEMVASYGMAVGREVFETCVWIGRFMQARGAEAVTRMPRLDVKMHLCRSAKASDANIRQAIIDRFGGKDRAIGRKATPGPLYGISGDEWAALALALTWMDIRENPALARRLEQVVA